MKLFFFPTAIGEFALAWRENGVHGVFLPEGKALRKRLRELYPEAESSGEAPAFVEKLARKIVSHAEGKSQNFGLDGLYLDSLPPFHKKVYAAAVKIPSGEVLSYGELARKAGSPKAFRAVGQAMAKNPFPLVVPCHRVIASGKKPGGYSGPGGLDTKAKLLAIEAPGRRFF